MKVLLSILQVVRSQGANASTDRLSAIDYFGTGQTNGAQSSSKGQEEDDDGEEYEVGSESGGSVARTKRKQKDVERDVRTKKKKTRSNQEVEGNGCGFLLHLQPINGWLWSLPNVFGVDKCLCINDLCGTCTKTVQGCN